ncbi:outer membrane protein [Lentilitoribacter sp. EG35]|uniref:outer membrane protein n=1 Tax=Lentilitoribacter sp. EG35 TaxID=3234192 RepID=UPI0034614F81
MLHKLSVLTAVVCAVITTSCWADETTPDRSNLFSGWYGSVFVGHSSLQPFMNTLSYDENYEFHHSFDNGWVYGFTLGKSFENGLRLEAELSRAAHNLSSAGYNSAPLPDKSGGFEITYAFVNGWIDLPKIGRIQPYVGGGIGVGRIDSDIVLFDFEGVRKAGANLALQAGAGVTVPLSNNLFLDLGYRHKAIPNFNMKNLVTPTSTYVGSSAGSHNLQVGFTIHF